MLTRRALLLFLKFPTPGRVKTRLADDLGPDGAAAAYRDMVDAVLANLSGLDADLRILFDPPDARSETIAWLTPPLASAGVTAPVFRPQSAGDLGTRLEHAFAEAFAEGYHQVAAIGSDCITITPSILRNAWGALESHDAVLGPTEDGGYYLLGTRAHGPELFRNIPWSSESTLAATLSAAEASALSVAELPRLTDIDTLADWHASRTS